MLPKEIDSLPDEIWIEISQYLNIQDLLQLRLCSKKLNTRVSSRAIWKPVCYAYWLRHQKHDPFISMSDNLKDYTLKGNWFSYFRARNRIDKQIMRILHSITVETDSEKYWDKCQSLMKFKKEYTVPLLYRIVNQPYEMNYIPFDLLSLCQRILTSYRHDDVLDLFSYHDEALEFVHNAEEMVFLRLAAMDDSFDKLLKFRAKFFERIHDLIKKNFNNCVDDFMQLPTTLRVDKLICYMIETLGPLKGDRNWFLEDFIILRIYSGENNGHPLLLLSVIQALATKYGVETILCGSYLIVRDDRLKDKETYLTISSTGKPKIFTRGRLIRSLKHIVGSNDYTIQHEILPSILQPLKYKDLIATIFKELLPVYNKSLWCMVSPKTIESARDVFPHSGKPMSIDAVNYFLCIQKAAEISSKTELRISTLYTVTCREVFRSVPKLYPTDLDGVKSLLRRDCDSFVEPFLSYEEWLLQLHNICLQTKENMGMFVVSSRDLQLMCIVGTKEFGNQHIYYTLMNALGEFYIELDENVEPCDWNSNRDLINDFLLMASGTDLGLIFSGVDMSAHQLKINCMVTGLIENKTERIDLIF